MCKILQLLSNGRLFAVSLMFLLIYASNITLAQTVSVLEAQQYLHQNGYSKVVADGIMGQQTRRALTEFQRDHDILETGLLDEATSTVIRSKISPQSEIFVPLDFVLTDGEKDITEHDLKGLPKPTLRIDELSKSERLSVANKLTIPENEPTEDSWSAVLWGIGVLVAFWVWWRGRNIKKGKPSGVLSRNEKSDLKANDFTQESGRLGRKKRTSWFRADESAVVAGRNIGGMIYVGTAPRANGCSCGAYIDPSLHVAKIGNEIEGQGMHYWPNYSDISATARATYLNWLQSGRSDPDYNVGYMFLYFYGLERHFFLDHLDDSEKVEILKEVLRLRQLFSENNSAQNYLTRFIEFARLSLDSEEIRQPIFSHAGYDFPLSLSVILGGMVGQGKPLTADWALSWLLCHPERRLRTPAHRCEDEFRALFRLMFMQRYPNGMKVRCPKKTMKINYHAASGDFDLEVVPMTNGISIPDISRIKKPLNDAQKIADSAMDELDKFSRYLGRNPDGRGSVEAQALLPAVLWHLFPSLELDGLREWVHNIVAHDGLVPVVDVVQKLENVRPDKLGKRQLTDAADALARLGYGMAPDPRFALRSPKFNDPVVLFKLPEGETQLEDVSDLYRSALMEIALGTFIAQADGIVMPTEEDALKRSVQSFRGLSLSESARLDANLVWLLAVPSDISVFRTKLKNATEEQRNVFRQVVVTMAHADSVVQPEEIVGIEKVYKVLGLDPSTVYSDIHSAAILDSPVAVREARAGTAGEAIPDENGPILDVARIAAIKTDTARVSSVLGEIFGLNDEPDADETSQDDEVTTRFNGLDVKHSAFAIELIECADWSQTDFEELSGRYGLMPAGCLETINEWAFENFNDALIEEYEGYELNPDITSILRQK